MAKTFKAEFKSFFCTYLHSTDSALVRKELKKIWDSHQGQNLEQELDFGDFELNIISCIKYISRKQGLDPTVANSLISSFISNNQTQTTKSSKSPCSELVNYQIAQTVKYAVAESESVLDFVQLFTAIDQFFKFKSVGSNEVKEGQADSVGINDSSYQQAILSQLVECVAIKLTQDNCHVDFDLGGNSKNETIPFKLKKYISFVDTRTKSIVFNKFEKLGLSMPKSSGTGSNPTLPSHLREIDLDEESQGHEPDLLTDGRQLLGQCAKKEVKADAVKTQQTVTSVHKQNVSEKSEIENINLTNALNSGKSNSRATNITSEINPTLNNSGSSVRSYFRTTAMEVAFLLDRANSANPICDDDLVYLKNKFIGWKWTVYESYDTTDTSIATIFSVVSKNQRIDNEIQDDLAEGGFENNRSDICRLKLLKMFQFCAERNRGKLPEKSSRVLTTFRRSSNCTDEMKKILWQIFARDDNNLYENFRIALDELERYKGIVGSDTGMDEKLDYIHEQIVQEQRAKSLNEKSSFFQTLMGIVMDGDHYGNYMRSKVAQIMDDYLCHESTGGLSIGQMESFVTSYQTSSQSPQWSEIDRNLFTTSLIRCILSTLNKPKTDIAKIPSFILAALVEISADDSADWRVGALIMISLGNIVIANEGIKIPNASLLAKKLKKVDAVDKDGNVFIADEDKVQQFEEQCNLTYISAMAAHIILQSLFPRDIQAPEVEDDILEIFLTALNTSPDKNTRIICSEFVFRASQNQNNKLNEVSLWKLQPLTNDSIPDIRIYSTAAYVTFLEKLVAGKKTDLGSSLTPHDLDELMDMYATEKLEMDGTDYTTVVNSPILKILKHESNRLKFSNQLFQHLTWSLSTGGDQYLELTFVILEIVYAQISTSFKDSHLPENCLAAIENLFLTNDKKDIYGICSMILVRVSEGLHRSLSTRLLEALYTKLQGQSHGDGKLLCFRALFSAACIQDVPQYIFQGLDLFFVSQRLLVQLEESKDLSFYDNFKPQINSTRKLEAYKSNLMDTIIRYLDKGSRPPIPTIELLRTCLQQEWNLEKVLYSLTIAAENGQLLPSSALQYAFVPSRFENKDFFKLLLKLALALVQNNQNLDDKFLDFISNRFCSSTFKTMFGSDDEDEMIFWILTRCIQTNHRVKQLPKLILKFCAAWKEKSSENHRQRLEILAALSAVVNCGEEMEELNPVELREVFLDAIQSHNPQILETGLHGCLALNTTFQSKCEVSLCDSTDVKLLVQIQRSESSSNSVKVLITDFLEDRKKKLSAGLQVSINLSNLENRTNKEFVSDLPMLLKLGDYEFFESKLFQEKIATILETEESNEILESIILILLEYPHPGNLPMQTLEAVAFSHVNNSEPNNFRLSCQQLLIKVLDLDTGITFSSKLIRYLEADTKFNSNLILKIISKLTKNDQEISRKLQGMVEIQTLLESNKLTEKKLNKILADAQGGAIQLDLTSFEQLLCLKFVQPGISPRVMTFIATNILCNDIPSDPESRVKAMKILEHCLVKKGGQGQDSTLEAFAKVLSKEGSLDQPKECVQALFNSWTNINSERKCTVQKQSLILTALALTFKSAHPRQFPYVPYKTVQWLAELVESSVAIIRKLSIRALRSLKPESVIHTKPDSSGLRSLINCTGIFKSKVDKKPIKKKDDDVDVDKIDIHLAQRFRQIEFLIFQEIYPAESDEKILSEIERDPEFTERLIELLYSLTFWDLKSLQAVRGDRSQWFRLLLLSDFLANYTDSINAQFEIYPSLKKLVEIAVEDDEDVEELFHLLHLRFNDPDLKISLSLIPSLLQSLMLLENQQIWSLLKGQVGDNWLRNLDEFVLAKYLKNKMSTSVSSTFALIFAKRMVNQIGTEFGKELCRVIESIESVASLESLLDIFEGMDKATLRQLQENVKLDQQGTKLKIKDLKIILESQILQDNIPKDLKRRARIERILKALLTNGIPREVISRLMDLTICKRGSKSPLKTEGRARAFEHVIGQASQYRMNSNIFSSLVTILESVSSADLIQSTNQFISEQVFDGKSGVKDIHQVINEFRLNNSRTTYKWACLRQRFLKSGYEWNILKLKIIQVMNGDKFSEIYKPELTRPKEICDWTKIDIKAWAAEAKVNHETMPQNEFYLEALMVARIAIKLHRNFDLTRVQILCCLTALQKLEKDKNKGQLQQVATGSGKSAIIAVLATIKALEGNFVDIYTSSPVLAERDAKEWSTFYSIFDDLSCDHNGDKGSDYISGAKRCYSKRIVYGDCSQFQFDYLRDKYSALGTLDGRTCDYAIVDEVDSMLLDDSAKLARLSSTLPGMDTMEIIYHFLWDRLSYLKTHLISFQGQYLYLEGKSCPKGGVISYDFADADTNELANIPDLLTFILTAKPYDLESVRIFPIEDFETFIRSKLTDYASSLVSNPTLDIKLPKYLKEFVRTQIPAWIDSLLTAIKFEENIHYIVDEEQIKPVDFETTGIVQSSTNWNNGLHQFLGLKHSLKIHPETLTTNFLSNLSMFDKYGSNMMGFTGTLGLVTGKAILYNVYKVKLLTLPETNFKRYIQFPDIVVANEEQWLKEIVISTMAEASKGRGILVICETIKSANLISAVLTSFKAKVKLYTRNEDEEQEKHIERMHPGDIIVATNLAGRGTDIKTLEIEPFGGLHVCLTFLPQSERIEAQAFGRTSRQGNKGTGQLVIVQNQQEIKMDYKTDRDLKEKSTLESFVSHQLPQIRTKGQLFEMFCKYINQTRQNLLKNWGICDKVVDFVKDGVNTVSMGLAKVQTNQLSMFDTLVLQSLEERWAMFLRRVDDEKLTNDQALEEYAKFEQKNEEQFRTGTRQVIINGANPFPFIQLGNHEFVRKNTEKASGYFESALKMDPDFAVGALVGIASVLLKDSKANDFKERAIRQFKDSLMILNKDMAFITVMQTLVQKQFPDGEGVNTPLFQQLMEKANLIGYFINTIQANIDGVERSLRRVHFGGVKKSSSNQRQELLSIPNEILQAPASSRTLPSNYKEYEGCRLTFHDLTHRNDSGVRDQAVNSLPNIKTSKIGLRCKSADIKKLIQDSETDLIKEGIPIMTLQLNCLEFNKESGNIIFNFDLLKVKIDSYDLEVLVGDSEKLKEITFKLHDHFKNSGQLKTIEVTMSNTDNSQSCVSIVETLNASKVANISSHLTSIKILNLLSPTEVNAVAQIAGTLTSFGVPLSFNLTFNSIQQDKSLIIQSWDAVLSHYNNSVFHLCGMSSKQAKKIIPLMRKYNVGFLLDICDLDFTSAVKLLQNASIEQELMEESKMQKLTELFMPDRIPLREIMEMNARGLYLLISFNEKQFVPWISVLSVCGLAAVQVAVGGLLITTGFGASLGMSLITEGMSDFTTAYRAYSSRQFNWSDYRTQKAVSLVISATTLGLSGLKDGGKGLSILGSQFSGGAASNAAVSYTGKNLQSLAIKFVAVRGTETVARIGLKSLADNLSSFCFEQIRDTIQVEVSSRVEAAFASQEFYESLSRAMAVENIMQPNAGKGPNGPSRLKKKIDGWVIATTNPKASGWTSWWDSVGSPLANGILADPNFVGSSWNTAVLCVGALSGIAQIGTVISKVCNDIQSKLNEERERDYLALLTSKGVLEETLRTITTKIKTSSSGYNKLELSTWSDSSVFSNKDEFKTFQSVFQKLKEQQSQIKKKSLERSMIEKGVVDLITSHIIKTANSHLVSPVLSKFAGQIVNSISEELQARFSVNDAQDSKEYPSQSRTLKGQIEANAKEHMITHQKQEMEKICNEAIERNQENPNSENQVSQEKVLDMAKGILTDAPLSSVMLSMAAKQNGIDIKIVTDPNYQATPEEKAAGIRIIVYESPPPGSPPNTIGHYLLKNENCDGFENVDRGAPNDKNNCGYNIIATLANKETDEVRSELGKSVLDNPEQFDKFLETEEWIHSRYPQEANTILGVGGRSSTPMEDIKRYLWPVEENKIIRKSEDEKISLDNGIDPNDENLNKERPVYTKYTVTKDDLGQGQPTSANKELAKETRGKGISGDHACHVRSNREGGPMIPENLYPGNPSANNSTVKQIENARVKWINNGPEGANVEVEQRLIYSDDPNRPDKVYILNKYMVGDQPATSEQLRNIRVENTELFMVPNLPPNKKMAPTQRSPSPKTVNKTLDNLESWR